MNMELSDAQLRAYSKAKWYLASRRMHLLVMLGATLLLGIVWFAVRSKGELSHFFQILFLIYAGMIINLTTINRMTKRYLLTVVEIADQAVNSDASNIERLAVARGKLKW
ncbi:MAG TPA: hypothetical protein VFL15_07975 [Gammaproteobacteria bacterium]|nr:hypothetical protein [Gammaproteobacteria bacterium]